MWVFEPRCALTPKRKIKSAEIFGAFLFAYAAEASRVDFAMFNFAAPNFFLDKNNSLNFQFFFCAHFSLAIASLPRAKFAI